MFRNKLILALALLVCAPSLAAAASATIYADTGGCNTASTTQCSGTTDSATASASGASATITCSAVAGPAGAPGCSITGSAGQLSGIAVDGSQAVFVNCATNATQKIFFINAVDNGAGLVGTTVTPTGCTAATSDWGIGGRYIFPSGSGTIYVVTALRAGDTLQFNNDPAARSTSFIVQASSGSSSGYIRVIGKTGVDHPYLHNNSGNVSVVNNGGFGNWWMENLKMQSDGATSSAIIQSGGTAPVYNNIKITGTAAGTAPCITNTGTALQVMNSEITGCAADGINSTAASNTIVGNYIHANGGDGIELTSIAPTSTINNNIISANGARGLYFSGAPTTQQHVAAVMSNTFYANTSPNIEVADADYRLLLRNNISSNASANTVKWAAGTAEAFSIHSNNTFFGAGGVSGLTLNSTETSSDPLLSNPGSGVFTIPSNSPAAGTGYPGGILGTSTGYIDMGAVQHQGGSGGSCIGC